MCSLDIAFTVATVRNRSRDPRMAVPMGSSAEVVLLGVADVSLLRFAWQAWHFVTFRRALERVESRFAWQAQYFCDVFRRCVAVFVAGAALWTCPSSFFVAGAALCVFFVNRIGRAASSGDKVQIPWQAWHFVTCAEN